MTREQRVLHGVGSLARLPGELDALGAERLFLVTGTRSFEASGARAALATLLRGRTVTRLACTTHVTELAAVQAGRDQFRAVDVDLVLAVGGGRVLDTAKLVGEGALPLIAVPTTAGSGSEATRFAAVYRDGVKASVDDEALRPDVAIVDPDLVRSMPPGTAAASGFDALSQAIESSWSIRSTPASTAWASRAIGLAAAHLRGSTTGVDASRVAMAEAAHMAGRAIDVTRTTAAHALSYGLTWHHGIPHGHAVALTLGRLLEFNAGVGDDDCLDPRGPAHVRRAIATVCRQLGCAGPTEARRFLQRLMADCGLTPYTEDLQLGPTELAAAVAGVDPARLGNNPRRLVGPTLLRLFETHGDPA